MAMTTCRDDLLQMYAEGGLGSVERSIVEAHLAGCSACRAQLAGYKALLWDLGPGSAAAEPEPVPAELQAVSDRLMAAWEADVAERERPTAGDEPAPWLLWTQAPPVQTALGAAGRAGRAVPRLGWQGVSGLVRLLGKGGERRR